MLLFSPNANQKLRQLVLHSAIILILAGCQYMPFKIPVFSSKHPSANSSPEKHSDEILLKRIYIQNFSGQKVKEVQAVFFEAAKEQSHFAFIELLPDELSGLGILRIDVTDYQIWETDEVVKEANEYPTGELKAGDLIKRRNAIVSMKVNLYEARTGKNLVSRRFSQPFQQIYVGKEAIESRPDNNIELVRLTKMLVFSMLDSFLSSKDKTSAIRYEAGSSYGWFADKIHNFGNSRLKKGIRFAEAGKLDDAIWIWKIFLFAPDEGEPADVYFKNRAAAYNNLGLAFQQKRDWWKAAEMFSAANRISQKLKYAQAWGNNLQTWLEEQHSPKRVKVTVPVEKGTEKQIESMEEKRPAAVINLEENDQLLLQPRILWPLDPHLKQQEKALEGGKQTEQ